MGNASANVSSRGTLLIASTDCHHLFGTAVTLRPLCHDDNPWGRLPACRCLAGWKPAPRLVDDVESKACNELVRRDKPGVCRGVPVSSPSHDKTAPRADRPPPPPRPHPSPPSSPP